MKILIRDGIVLHFPKATRCNFDGRYLAVMASGVKSNDQDIAIAKFEPGHVVAHWPDSTECLPLRIAPKEQSWRMDELVGKPQ